MRPGGLPIVASISVEVLPYQAIFVADPFLFQESKYLHLFCEVLVSGDDKRIAHLRSQDLAKWEWVTDLLTGDNYSFPAIYGSEREDVVIVVPQISGTNDLRAFSYSVTDCAVELLWSVELEQETRDPVFITNPSNSRSYLVYGAQHNLREALWVSETTSGPVEVGSAGMAIGPAKVLAQQPLLSRARDRWLRKQRLTYRPAGTPLDVNSSGFILPVQATRRGVYGEMLALVRFNWDFSEQGTVFLPADSLVPGANRVHHVSSVKIPNGWVACIDVIPDGGNRWELRLARSTSPPFDDATQKRNAML